MLLRLDEHEHVLLIMLHHIVSDGWSLGMLVRELTSFYAALSKVAVPPCRADRPVCRLRHLAARLAARRRAGTAACLTGVGSSAAARCCAAHRSPPPGGADLCRGNQFHILPADLRRALEQLNQSAGGDVVHDAAGGV